MPYAGTMYAGGRTNGHPKYPPGPESLSNPRSDPFLRMHLVQSYLEKIATLTFSYLVRSSGHLAEV
jgi:hypothetical protein